jgi:hypothetical protein
MSELMRTGGRVSMVTEEGHVTVYCYSLQKTFEFQVVPCAGARAWGAMLGQYVTLTITDEKLATE